MSACKSCGAPIRWCKTERGKNIPVDDAPSPAGNLDIGRDGIARVVTESLRYGQKLYQSHFVTCPEAAQHRRAR